MKSKAKPRAKPIAKPRAAVILIDDHKIALIERYRARKHYFVIPGGKVEPDETPEEAARREIKEELGLDVKIQTLVAEIWYLDTPQYYFLGERVSGNFGSGSGKEMTSLAESPKGSHEPVWLPLDELLSQPVLPKLIAEIIIDSHPNRWPAHPFIMTDPTSEG